MFKKSICIFVVVSMFLLLVIGGCGQSSQQQSSSSNEKEVVKEPEKVVLRISNMYAEETSFGEACDLFKEIVEKESNGSIEVEVFHDGSLGGEKDVIQALRSGSLEMMFSGTAGLGLYVPEIQVFELPYLYSDMNELTITMAHIKEDVGQLTRDKGFELLGFFYDGPRNILSTKPIRSLADMRGLKFRVPTATLYTEMAKALGAKPVAMSLGEVYTSMETGVIEAMEGSPDSVYRAKYHEVGKYYIEDKHIYQALSIIINTDTWNGLTEEQKNIIQIAVDEASNFQANRVEQINKEATESMRQEGVEIITLESLDEFKQAVEKMNEDFVKSISQEAQTLYNKIKEL